MSSTPFYASTPAGPSNPTPSPSATSSTFAAPLPPLRCPLCPAAGQVHFLHDLALEAHLAQTHFRLRPFKCLECPPTAAEAAIAAFPTEWAFLDHLAYAHGQHMGRSLLQIDLELVNKRRQIQRLITCAILARESSRMIETAPNNNKNNNNNNNNFGMGEVENVGEIQTTEEAREMSSTNQWNNGERNAGEMEVKKEAEEEEMDEQMNGGIQGEENGGIKRECSEEPSTEAMPQNGFELAQPQASSNQLQEKPPPPFLSAAEMEAAELFRSAALKLSQSLLKSSRQNCGENGEELTTPAQFGALEWTIGGHSILEEENGAKDDGHQHQFLANNGNNDGGSQNGEYSEEEGGDEHWIGQRNRRRKKRKQWNGGGGKPTEKKVISEEEEKEIHQFVANLLQKEKKRRAEMMKEVPETKRTRGRTTSENI